MNSNEEEKVPYNDDNLEEDVSSLMKKLNYLQKKYADIDFDDIPEDDQF